MSGGPAVPRQRCACSDSRATNRSANLRHRSLRAKKRGAHGYRAATPTGDREPVQQRSHLPPFHVEATDADAPAVAANVSSGNTTGATYAIAGACYREAGARRSGRWKGWTPR
jgi:hypothetical protein